MKILHAAETIRGGIATVIRLHVQAQAEEFSPESVVVLAPEDQINDLDGVAPFGRATFRRTGRNPGSMARLAWRLVCVVWRENPDIVHLHSTFAGVIGRIFRPLLWALGRRARFLYCPHGWAFSMQVSQRRKRLFATIEKMLLRLTDRVICVSQFEVEQAAKYGIAGKKVAHIYNGVPIPSLPVKKTYAPHLRLLFVGRLDHAKGYDILLRILQGLPPHTFHLTIIGAAVHDNVVPPGHPNVTCTGWVTPEAVVAYYQHADVLVMPSRSEGFAMSPLEAMSYATPVLASRVASLPEVVIDGQTGRLARPEDPDDFVRILQETTPAQWHAMGQTARAYVEENFSAEQMQANTIALYRSVLSEVRSPIDG